MPMLEKIRKIGDKARSDFVRTCDKEFLYCISECAKNVIKGNVPLTDSQSEDHSASKEEPPQSVVCQENFAAKQT